MNIIVMDEKWVDEFWKLRLKLFKELGEVSSNSDVHTLETATKKYYLSHINKDLISWGTLVEGHIAATGSLCLFDRIPYQENPRGREGYILNIYTMPEYRSRGFADCLVKEIILYASKMNIPRLWLNSSKQGQRLYEKYGFKAKDNEMELFL